MSTEEDVVSAVYGEFDEKGCENNYCTTTRCVCAKHRMVKEIIQLRASVKEVDKDLHNAEVHVEQLIESNNKVMADRDEALTKWHAHQKNVPCGGCKGGHDTYWGTVVSSKQWKAWTESKEGRQWDVDECQECGHISQGHFQEFLKFCAKEGTKVAWEIAEDLSTVIFNAEMRAKDKKEASGLTSRLLDALCFKTRRQEPV